ncbi:hypothetical protein BATDEDRAFT_84986 [Batrachochytrium dendrobatidis JAM81]|uniref:Sepiapterin reductase n=2 Tax=Batrachochytrium dendrobatidis TaxID=109871 RepID=F4NSN2_BATDJ|nr:uncharacterized protein BATDEDRAFT_84986 [Batrachochytrium dendrobatidis JAM81]EGF83437.1 hypothetical protein BATDEDRAFT_84986 [Batrachochytrium dendrobatidis JAM81]KAK5668249.1 hypothetical protein QVD99_005285 [Batrachochytrium dendrobatidis]|eukprot:XP_006676098.1 hypothetical protein BATDEDRAFT_84986 [Batrachochytrium dendrobatidis JAM81]
MSSVAAYRNLFIITGASKGFGKSIALALADSPLLTAQPTDVLLVARNLVELNDVKAAVEQIFQEAHVAPRHSLSVHVCTEDFSSNDMDVVSQRIISRSAMQSPLAYTTAVLFNNAGTLGTLSRIRDQTISDMRKSIDVNLMAPLVLSAAFLKQFADCSKLILVNVSSLAAIQPFDTWGVYSSIKAARDMFHQVIAVEEANIDAEEALSKRTTSPCSKDTQDTQAPLKSARVRVLNYAPGPMDTDMQTRIRNEMPEIELKQAYVKMHDQGQLVDPNDSASVLMSLLESDDYINGSHIDYYDVQNTELSKK